MSRKMAWVRVSSCGECGAALGPQRLRPVQHLRNPPLLRRGGQRRSASSQDRRRCGIVRRRAVATLLALAVEGECREVVKEIRSSISSSERDSRLLQMPHVIGGLTMASSTGLGLTVPPSSIGQTYYEHDFDGLCLNRDVSPGHALLSFADLIDDAFDASSVERIGQSWPRRSAHADVINTS